jgi:probable DNA repair protein
MNTRTQIMDESLYVAAREGALILTVNDRLARSLSQQYDHEQQKQGLSAWRRPDILSLSAWLSRSQAQVPEMPLFLNKAQLQHSWEKIVASDVEGTGNQLLQIPQTAQRALQAHQLLIRYAAEFGMHEAAEDHRAFLRWRKLWQTQADQKGWQDPVEAPWLLATAITERRLCLPGSIVLAGFDEIAPDLLHLGRTMEEAGTSVSHWQPQPCQDVQRQRVTADDPADEVSLCARWIRSLLTENPAARIGVVAPQLEVYQSLIEQFFTAELAPESLLTGEETSQVFNLSLGRSLAREEVVHAALSLLRLGMQVDHNEVSWLLHTPYLSMSVTEGTARAQLDRELRRLRRFDWPLPKLTRTLKGLVDKYSITVPNFIVLTEVVAVDLRQSAKRMPGFWSEYIANFLHKLGWPGERGLSSREYQAVQHFRGLLGELASLDSVSLPISRSEAVKILLRMTNALEFQPEGGESQIQVLGELESSGLTFDHLWILGLHDSAMPKPPSPNPFVPLPVQRSYKMKRADADREHHFAEQLATRLFAAAPDVVFSWPRQEKGAEQRPSSFISDIADVQLALGETCAPARTLWLGRPALEKITDNQGPGISSRKPFTGGTGIIKDQALCPFRAFAHHRLRAERLDEPDVGIDNMSRGTLVHTVLELFWAKAGDRDTLLALDESKLDSELNEAVDGALDRLEREGRYDLPVRQRQIERQRLLSLAGLWLQVEERRGPFRVLSSEKSHQVKIGNLAIRTRIDRVDELDDGTCAIIDYKTGRPDPLQWLDDRVTEPQLPAYCLGMSNEKVGAVMFATVRSKERERGFCGVSRDIDSWPGAKSRSLEARLEEKGLGTFEEVLAHWEKVLPTLGDDFARGEATVDPVDPDLACKYCDLKGFCRILEQEVALPGNADD